MWQLVTCPGSQAVRNLHGCFKDWVLSQQKPCTAKTRNALVEEFVDLRRPLEFCPGNRVQHVKNGKIGEIQKLVPNTRPRKWLVLWESGYTNVMRPHLLQRINDGSRCTPKRTSTNSASASLYMHQSVGKKTYPASAILILTMTEVDEVDGTIRLRRRDEWTPWAQKNAPCSKHHTQFVNSKMAKLLGDNYRTVGYHRERLFFPNEQSFDSRVTALWQDPDVQKEPYQHRHTAVWKKLQKSGNGAPYVGMIQLPFGGNPGIILTCRNLKLVQPRKRQPRKRLQQTPSKKSVQPACKITPRTPIKRRVPTASSTSSLMQDSSKRAKMEPKLGSKVVDRSSVAPTLIHGQTNRRSNPNPCTDQA